LPGGRGHPRSPSRWPRKCRLRSLRPRPTPSDAISRALAEASDRCRPLLSSSVRRADASPTNIRSQALGELPGSEHFDVDSGRCMDGLGRAIVRADACCNEQRLFEMRELGTMCGVGHVVHLSLAESPTMLGEE